MNGAVDLHLHTTCSDGLVTPDQLLEKVRHEKLAAFAITDHDTLEGYSQVKKLLREGDPKLVPGVELSVMMETQDLHLLVYELDPEDEEFNSRLAEFQNQRNQRARLMVDKLKELGLDLQYEEVARIAAGGVVGRPHIAEAMVNQGLVRSFEAAFYKYIGTDGPAYTPKAKLLPAEAIRLAHDAGGVAVMAHPMIGQMWRHIELLAGLGLDGIELYHYSLKRSDEKRLKSLAKQFRLIATGGSDFHGRSEREATIGSQQVPFEVLDELKKRATQIRGNT